MLGVAPLRNRKVLSSGFSSLGKEDLTLMYNDGDKAFGTAADLCVGERMRIALNGIVIASVDVIRRDSDKGHQSKRGEKVVSSPNGLKGRIKVTTRCLWVDRGKLLEALQKAASAALASLRLDSTLGLVEHTVGIALRKVVQKYSNRRPDVIVIATESAPSFTTETKKLSLQERVSSFSSNGAALHDKQIVHSTRERHVDTTLPPERALSASSATEKASASPEDNQTAVDNKLPLEVAEVLDSAADMVASSSKMVPDLVTDLDAGSHTMAQMHTATFEQKGIEQSISTRDSATALAEGESSMEKSEEDQDGNAELAAPIKRRKWKSNEIFSLIEARKHKEIDLRQGQGRKGLWKGVSNTLAKAGFDRSPEQCKTVWFTLVKRYKSAVEDVKKGVTSSEPFLFYDAMETAVAEIEKMESREQ